MTSSEDTKFDIVISGGSFAGLALALGLSQAARDGLRIAIVDRAPSNPSGGDARAFAIWASGKTALEGLGAWTALADEAEAVTSIEITDSGVGDGVRPARLVYDSKLADGEPAAHVVPAAALHRALHDLVTQQSSIAWFAPADAIDLALGDLAAEIKLNDGRTLTAALCVAADGRLSKLRDAVGIKTVGWDYEQVGIVASVAFDAPHGGVAVQHFLPGGPFAVLPLKNNRACITWSSARSEAERMSAVDDAAFAAELDCRIAGRFGAVRLDGPRQSWPLSFKVPRSLTAKRFALIGDAAHGVHPIAGQGVNLALRDAAALVECIIDALRLGFDAGHAPALERYARWRRFDSLMSASLYDGLNRLFSVDNVVLRAMRGAGLGVLDQIPAVKQLIIAEAAGQTGELPKLMRGAAV